MSGAGRMRGDAPFLRVKGVCAEYAHIHERPGDQCASVEELADSMERLAPRYPVLTLTPWTDV
jgi:hypothetical protein